MSEIYIEYVLKYRFLYLYKNMKCYIRRISAVLIFSFMNIRRLVITVILMSTSVAVTHAATIEEAISAYNSGNYMTARRMFKEFAGEGSAVAQRYLAEMYDKGQGGLQDYGKAVEWYKKAAKKQDSKAQYLLAVKYINGHGVVVDEKLAYAWFAIAFNNGYEKAASSLRVLNQTLPMIVRQEALTLASKNLSELPD